MYCNSCGSMINEGQSFCANCGAPVTHPVQPAPQPVYQQPVPQAPAAVPVAVSSESLKTKPAKKDKYSRVSRRKVIVAGILGLFAGSIGVHNFVMKQPVRGVLHILLSFLPFLPVLLLFIDIFTSGAISNNISFDYAPKDEFLWLAPCYISGLWGFIESIILLVTNSKYHGQ